MLTPISASSNVNSKALAAASRRIAPVSIKRAKAESTEEASETAGESGDYDKVVAWVADKLKTYEGYDDFLAQRGVQGRQDSAIFKEAKWIKSFADSWNNRLAPADETVRMLGPVVLSHVFLTEVSPLVQNLEAPHREGL